jgi:hypothetical protein
MYTLVLKCHVPYFVQRDNIKHSKLFGSVVCVSVAMLVVY